MRPERPRVGVGHRRGGKAGARMPPRRSAWRTPDRAEPAQCRLGRIHCGQLIAVRPTPPLARHVSRLPSLPPPLLQPLQPLPLPLFARSLVHCSASLPTTAADATGSTSANDGVRRQNALRRRSVAHRRSASSRVLVRHHYQVES